VHWQLRDDAPEPSLSTFPAQPIVVRTSIRTGFGTGAPPPGGVVKPQPAAKPAAPVTAEPAVATVTEARSHITFQTERRTVSVASE